MSTESLPGIILTATVGIFSPDMKEVIVVVNDKLGGVVPVGGKYDPKRDRGIDDTARRESVEEAWILLFSGSGVFLSQEGRPISEQRIIQHEKFTFWNGLSALDALYFFRLHEKPSYGLKPGAYWIGKDQYGEDGMEIDDRKYPFLIPSVRRAILELLEKGWE